MANTGKENREDIEKLKRKYRSNYIPRIILGFIALGILHAFAIDPFVLVITGVYIGLALLWAVLVELEAGIIRFEGLRYARITLDSFYYTLTIYVTGGIWSFAVLSYLGLITLSSLYVTRRFGVFAIAICVAFYNAMLALIWASMIPALNILAGPSSMPAAITPSSVVLSNFLFIFLALLIHLIVHTNYRNLQLERDALHERNETIEFELHLARMIQERLIPSRKVAGFVHYLYRPMDQVGGDFFDFIEFPGRERIGIFLSDVSGHGVPAAFITSMIKTTILQAGERTGDPAGLLTYMNDLLQDRIAGNFITAFYGIFDPATRTIRYSNAGHPQPYIITERGELSQLQRGRNTALAMFPLGQLLENGMAYVNYEDVLPAGSRLLLYTDGLIEARPNAGGDDRFFEQSGLTDALREFGKLPGAEFIDALVRRLEAHRGGSAFEDDICLICIDIQ